MNNTCALVVHLILIFPFPSASQPCSSGFSGFRIQDSSAFFHSYATLFARFKCRYNASWVGGRSSGANNPFLNTLYRTFLMLFSTSPYRSQIILQALVLYLLLNADSLQFELELFDKQARNEWRHC